MTSEIRLRYGDADLAATIPGRDLGTIAVRDVPPVSDAGDSVRRAIERPVGLERGLTERVGASDWVTILVSDSFRQTRADLMVPPLLSSLSARGVEDSRVRILFSRATDDTRGRDFRTVPVDVDESRRIRR